MRKAINSWLEVALATSEALRRMRMAANEFRGAKVRACWNTWREVVEALLRIRQALLSFRSPALSRAFSTWSAQVRLMKDAKAAARAEAARAHLAMEAEAEGREGKGRGAAPCRSSGRRGGACRVKSRVKGEGGRGEGGGRRGRPLRWRRAVGRQPWSEHRW